MERIKVETRIEVRIPGASRAEGCAPERVRSITLGPKLSTPFPGYLMRHSQLAKSAEGVALSRV